MKEHKIDDWTVTITDTEVPSGGKFVAKLKKTVKSKTTIRYAYGITYEEALENAKRIISELK